MDAGFLNVVEIGQYFMTKETEEFSQFTEAAACQGKNKHRNQKDGSEEHFNWARIGSCGLVSCTANMELTSESSQ